MSAHGPRGWAADVPPDFRELAERALERHPRQLEALQLKSHGLGDRAIALLLGIKRSSVRDRLQNARVNVQRARAAEAGQ